MPGANLVAQQDAVARVIEAAKHELGLMMGSTADCLSAMTLSEAELGAVEAAMLDTRALVGLLRSVRATLEAQSGPAVYARIPLKVVQALLHCLVDATQTPDTDADTLLCIDAELFI